MSSTPESFEACVPQGPRERLGDVPSFVSDEVAPVVMSSGMAPARSSSESGVPDRIGTEG